MSLSDYFTGLPLRHFGAGIGDPGWNFSTWSANGRGKCADQKYTCQSLDDILRLPVGDLFLDDAAFAIWYPQYAGPQCWPQDTLRAWGFEPKTEGAWAKQSETGRKWFFGQGKILRSAAEFYMIGTRGHPELYSKSVRNLIVAPWCGHSRKPDQLHRDMEKLYGGPRIELFARRCVEGWSCWGDQLEAKQVGLDSTRPDRSDVPSVLGRL
jgi:N6-adenosine-specific RNA methylase IME4